MKIINVTPIIKIGFCAIVLAGFISRSQGANPTVGVMNPITPTAGIANSSSNQFNPVFITVANMTIGVANAFANNKGGVIDWEGANGWSANSNNFASQTVSYGVAQTNLLTITRNDGVGNTFGPTTLGGSPTTSGTNYLGIAGSGSPVTLNFSAGLTAWGMTELNRFATRTVTFSFTLANGAVINFNPQVQDPAADNTGVNYWYGISVNELNPIVQVNFVASGFTRFDDMAFIVSPTVIPEPTSFALFGLGSLVSIMAVRRRRN